MKLTFGNGRVGTVETIADDEATRCPECSQPLTPGDPCYRVSRPDGVRTYCASPCAAWHEAAVDSGVLPND